MRVMTAVPRFVPADPAAEYFTDERCHILELSNTADDHAVSVARARVEPGVTTARHRVLDTVERYVILSGVGRLHIDGLPEHDVAAGGTVVIPAGVVQSITNTGAEDLVFLCICTPRFKWENYESVE
jgi:mannose-6-phosphate isomerase-like protein (cupin superfamily)